MVATVVLSGFIWGESTVATVILVFERKGHRRFTNFLKKLFLKFA